MVQEVYDTHPALREACNRSIGEHAATLVPDIEEARRQRGIEAEWTAESLALYMQATTPGRVHPGQGQEQPRGSRGVH